jgi:radical SAM superfamily enzyme YgiQ (UPF0313 family)
MRITLFDYAYENFAIQYLAAELMHHGYSVEIHFDSSMSRDWLSEDLFCSRFLSISPEGVAREILRTDPQVVGFSLKTIDMPDLKQIIRAVKRQRPDTTVIVGGPHCMVAFESIVRDPDIDFVFKGDADISLPDLIGRLENHPVTDVRALSEDAMPGVSSVWNGRVIDRGWGPLMSDLDSVPFPAKEPYYRANPSLKTVYTCIASRGCVWNCTYCNSATLKRLYRACGQAYYRARSVDNVIDELKEAKTKYAPKYVVFLDNLFALREGWVKKFSEMYPREVGLPFFCETNPNVHSTRTIDSLAQAGCYIVQFGFQSANEDVRKNLLRRPETNAKIMSLVRRARERGMFVCVDHIANLPGETREHLDEAVAFYRDLRPHWVNLGFLQYYPGAEIVEMALSRQVLTTTDLPKIMGGTAQSSFRLLSKSGLDAEYRMLPVRFFLAFKIPKWLGIHLDRFIIGSTVIRRIISRFASLFIYTTRIMFAFLDRRDFLVRHHLLRNAYVVKTMLLKRIRDNG